MHATAINRSSKRNTPDHMAIEVANGPVYRCLAMGEVGEVSPQAEQRPFKQRLFEVRT